MVVVVPSEYEMALQSAAELACDRAAEFAGRQLRSLRGGRLAFYPIVDADKCRFGVGVIDEYHYLVYQNDGFATFTMRSLAGKTVPMIIDGQLIFRKVTKVNEFRPGRKVYWRRDSNGVLMPSEEQRRAWVHPGLPPKSFIEDGVEAAGRESADDMFHALMRDIGVE